MKVIGIAIGGTKSAVTLAEFTSSNLTILNKLTFKTTPDDYQNVIDNIDRCIKELNTSFSFISIICGGPLDVKKGTINTPPHLPGFKDVEIVKYFKEKYNVPTSLLNDADACALAEYYYGSGSKSTNMAYITFGTGIGAGLILNHKLYTGNNGMAGEVGHVRISNDGPVGYGVKGSVEGWCAGGNIPKWANLPVNNTKEIFDLAHKGDKSALEVVDKLIDKLSQSLSILIDILNLDTIVLGGIYPRNLDLLEDKLKEKIKDYAISFNYEYCTILPAKLKEQIDDYSSLMGYLKDMETDNLYSRYPALLEQKDNIEHAITALVDCYRNGGKILVCGNGGSSSDSGHIVGELMKGFRDKRPLQEDEIPSLDKDISCKLQRGIPAIDLTAQSGLITAFANDVDPELIFAQQVLAYSSSNKNDVLIGLSTSGNSKNVVKAFEVAKSIGIKTISLTGSKDSKMSELANIAIKAPEVETYKVQEYHLPIYHYICMEVERILFK